MELSQPRTFRAVAETLNFTRAAERLGLTQSAVSHQIKSPSRPSSASRSSSAPSAAWPCRPGRPPSSTRCALDEAEALRERGGRAALAGRPRARRRPRRYIVHLFAPLFEAFMRAQPRIDVRSARPRAPTRRSPTS
ncbi:MAG: LysR family transcriptional regulator [Vicinamibacteria bacterium]